MHPAASVIFFTVSSGAGYGLAMGLILFALFGPTGTGGGTDLILAGGGFCLSLALIAAGLLSSLLHLGHPERAWCALSQWRTSWLSREGVMALITFIPLLVFGWSWVIVGEPDLLAGVLAMMGALGTVWCTAMIYASLKPIRRWRNGFTGPGYLALSAASGSVLLAFLVRLSGQQIWAIALAPVVALGLAAILKSIYWRWIDQNHAASTPESATGLGALGSVSLLEAPHTEENYLLKEMGFKVARKHAVKLRRLAMDFGFLLPIILTVLASLAGHTVGCLLLGSATALCLLGCLIERWLFFAEARHTITLYYGAKAA
jgi:sulfite dehydrogenase (quinone) subunit SoeC